MKSLPFDEKQALLSNLLISGANASGKTRLACSIASKFYQSGYTVIVIDVSGTWKNLSDLPYFVKVSKVDGEIRIPKFEQNTSRIYDLSNLKLSETKQVLDALSEQIWNTRTNQENPVPTFLFLEEAEGFLKSIRGKDAENIYRLIHVGRNINVRCALITTDLALIDASVIRLCSIRLHGFLNPEENSKRKIRSTYGKDWCRIMNEALDAGTFVRFRAYNRAKPLDVLSVPLFEAKSKPVKYIPAPIKKQIIREQPKQKSILGMLSELIIPTGSGFHNTATCTDQEDLDQWEDETEEIDGILFTE